MQWKAYSSDEYSRLMMVMMIMKDKEEKQSPDGLVYMYLLDIVLDPVPEPPFNDPPSMIE